MRFSWGSIHLPISSPLWWQAVTSGQDVTLVYTDHRVSGEEKSGRLMKEFKLWKMRVWACVAALAQKQGWKEGGEIRGKGWTLEGCSALFCRLEIDWSVSYCGPALWTGWRRGRTRTRTLSVNKHRPSTLARSPLWCSVSLATFNNLSWSGKHTKTAVTKKSRWKPFSHDALHQHFCFY